jgi:hypothetical protein
MTMGIVAVACFATRFDASPAVTIISKGSRTSSAAKVRRRSGFAFSKSPLNGNVFALDVAEFTQSLPEGLNTNPAYGTRISTQISYLEDFFWLLRLDGDCDGEHCSGK